VTIWLGIVAVMALAAMGFAASSADYTGLLGYFERPEGEPAAAGDRAPPRTRPRLIYVRAALPRGDDMTAAN